ncbi:hypothetical protein [Actinoplanes auranticolor]|uniref:Uncharacterized protein n=1 Tax=Actinoplanes auranticolor TaxID=47988 RepID=A0A919S5L4_9ACTN|nr:hypothetical protein [Actinoplanes auranticolor]GIM65871.1 hypothetical protein Aau02nite_20350 [Actinoplanes auranticolor]
MARADLREHRDRTGFGVATVPRAALLERFAAALPPGTLHFGRKVTGVTAPPPTTTSGRRSPVFSSPASTPS